VTNIRNTSSPHWRGRPKPESRCLVPFNSFAEFAPGANPETKKKDIVWFALNDDRRKKASGPARQSRSSQRKAQTAQVVAADFYNTIDPMQTQSCGADMLVALVDRARLLSQSRQLF
jgi:putative SOS response-associated peptidase YedK